tara:strand:+ start:324 stop:1082 length:759 start_codon:yes stop_codon:yes gene_type:complete
MIFRSKLKEPINFIVCGTQKGGTTALDYYLRSHQEICMAIKKEVHFFDNDNYFNHEKVDYEFYHKFFRPQKTHKIVGECTPIYMFWKDSMRRIYDYNSKIKLIIILRNPIERAFSHWNMEVQRKREHRTFWDAINEEVNNLSKNLNKSRTFSYLERGLYSSQIIGIHKYFERKQLLCLKSELLKSQPHLVLDEIANFLKVSKFNKIDKIDVHSRKYKFSLKANERNFLKRFFEVDIFQLENLIGWDLSAWKT